MTHRLSVPWPAGEPFPTSAEGPIRLLAVSDERDAALEHEPNRADLGTIDGVLACGDLDPDYLCFLGDAFHVPLLYIRGNHDRGSSWNAAAEAERVPRPLATVGERLAGLDIRGLSWPGSSDDSAPHDEGAAWRQAIGLFARTRLAGRGPQVILSHAPPRGLGDAPDPYHTGFAAYRWLCRSIHPVLWLHGHTNLASIDERSTTSGSTTLVNVTGAVLIQLESPAGGRPN